jgi:hypothetical protein
MGLLTGLLGLPVAPLRGVVAVADQVLRQAEDVYYDPAKIRGELEEVDRLRAAGELSEEQAEAWEDELIDRLMESNRRRGERER